MDKELTPKQQTSEAIRQAETILIMTGQHPSIDQVASTVALAALLRKFGKKVTAVISDEIPGGAKFLPINLVERNLGGLRDFIIRLDLAHAEVDKLKYTIENNRLNVQITPFAGGFQQHDVSFDYGDYQFDLVLILGVASYVRIDKVYAQNAELLRQIPLINIDFHRSNEQYGAINLVEGTAASLSEILIALSESLQSGMIDEQIATTMLTGIMAATDRFTATHTTSKTMTVAAQMMAMGADQQKVVRGLYRDRPDSRGRDNRDQKPTPPTAAPKPAARPVESVAQSTMAQPQPATASTPILPAASVPPSAARPSNPAPVLPPAPVPVPEPAPNLFALESPSTDDSQPDASTPQSTPVPQPDAAPSMEELLPPHHIELSEAPSAPPAAPARSTNPLLPEPLINDSTPSVPSPRPSAPPRSDRGANPTNNPVFAQRLDEFVY
jgi:hypothetical protein